MMQEKFITHRHIRSLTANGAHSRIHLNLMDYSHAFKYAQTYGTSPG